MQYQIMRQVAGKEFIPAMIGGKPVILNCPRAAAAEAKRLSRINNAKYQPRPMADTTWKDREKQRFTDGTYKPVCWAGQDWFEKNQIPDHFLHVSIKDPTRIAFTKSDKEGAADIQTAIKPGKYLTEFFKMLTAEQIRDFAMQHSTQFENKELKFAFTPEEIERVYKKEGMGSCFSGTDKANCYGSGDFAVAYIETDGDVKARVICCPERKIYTYAYGDRVRLHKLLNDAGYKDGGYMSGNWSGLRIVKKLHWRGFYTDFGGTTKPHPTDENYLVIA